LDEQLDFEIVAIAYRRDVGSPEIEARDVGPKVLYQIQ
jgi:hypothetical protein